MNYFSFALTSSKKIVFAAVLILSLLIAAYTPMASYSAAQSASSAQLQKLKEKAISEIDRRIANYKKAVESLKTDVSISKDGASGSASGNGSNLGLTLGKNGLTGSVSIPSDTKDKVEQFLQKMIEQLTNLKSKVQNTSSLEDMQSIAKNVDTQFDLGQLTQVQANVTKAVESATAVLDNLKTTFNDIQAQITALKECAKDVQSGQGSATGNANSSGANVSCSDFNLSSADVGEQAQSQLDGISSIVTTISSIVMSVVSLLLGLVTSFGSLTGGLGSLGSLGNLGNLGNLTNLSSLTGSLGSITGLMSSFSAITSQLDLANGMSGGALGSLTSLTSLINL